MGGVGMGVVVGVGGVLEALPNSEFLSLLRILNFSVNNDRLWQKF